MKGSTSEPKEKAAKDQLVRLDEVRSAPDWERPGLSNRGRRIAVALVEGFLCDHDARGQLVAADAAWCKTIVGSYDLSIGNTSRAVRLGIGGLLFLMQWLPIFVIGRASRMSKLSIADRARFLEALEAHRLGLVTMLLVAVKIPLLVSAFEDGEKLATTGFDRPNTAARRQLRQASSEVKT